MRKKIWIFVLPCMLAFSILFTGCTGEQNTKQTEHTTGLFAMGTYMTLTAYGENAETALADAEERIKKLETLWSVTDENSEVYEMNHKTIAFRFIALSHEFPCQKRNLLM